VEDLQNHVSGISNICLWGLGTLGLRGLLPESQAFRTNYFFWKVDKVNKKETATLISFSTDDLSVAYGYRVCIDSDQGHKEGVHFKVGWGHSTANLHPGMWDENSWSIGGSGNVGRELMVDRRQPLKHN